MLLFRDSIRRKYPDIKRFIGLNARFDQAALVQEGLKFALTMISQEEGALERESYLVHELIAPKCPQT